MECLCELYWISEFQRYTNWFVMMPWSYRINALASGPHECLSSLFTELGNQRGFRKASKIAQAFNSKSLQALGRTAFNAERVSDLALPMNNRARADMVVKKEKDAEAAGKNRFLDKQVRI